MFKTWFGPCLMGKERCVCVCVLYIFKNRIRERKVAYYNGSHWHNEYVENGQVSKALSLKEQAMSYHVQSIPEGDNLKQKKLCEWCYKWQLRFTSFHYHNYSKSFFFLFNGTASKQVL